MQNIRVALAAPAVLNRLCTSSSLFVIIPISICSMHRRPFLLVALIIPTTVISFPGYASLAIKRPERVLASLLRCKHVEPPQVFASHCWSKQRNEPEHGPDGASKEPVVQDYTVLSLTKPPG